MSPTTSTVATQRDLQGNSVTSKVRWSERVSRSATFLAGHFEIKVSETTMHNLKTKNARDKRLALRKKVKARPDVDEIPRGAKDTQTTWLVEAALNHKWGAEDTDTPEEGIVAEAPDDTMVVRDGVPMPADAAWELDQLEAAAQRARDQATLSEGTRAVNKGKRQEPDEPEPVRSLRAKSEASKTRGDGKARRAKPKRGGK